MTESAKDWPAQSWHPFLRCLIPLALCGLAGAGLAQAQPAVTPPGLAVNTASPSDPTWQQLSARQKQALAPLASAWPQLTPQQRSKWLSLSQSYESLTPAEQQTVHQRMAEWAGLSPQERARARLNYSHLQTLSREERKAQWEAYQALSEEEKRRLQSKKPAPRSAAPVSRPQPARIDRLVQPPAAKTGPATNTVKIDRKTLLPMAAEASPASAATASTASTPATPELPASTPQPGASE